MPALVETTLVRRHDRRDGDWLEVRTDGRRIRVEAGGTGNRLDPDRRVRRTGWDMRRVGDQLELLATWPVPEVVTHRIGEQVAQLVDDSTRAGGDPAADLRAVADAVLTVLGVGAPGVDRLDALLWAGAYPLLQVPVEHGARPDDLPLALDHVLRAGDARRAARRAFGRVTRPLVRAFAASLLPDEAGRIPFEPALLALMASPWCGPEQLTRILETRPHRAGAVSFDVAEVDRARAVFAGVPPRRITDRLTSALTDPDGLRALAGELAAWAPPRDAPPAIAPTRTPPTQAPSVQPPAPARTDVPLRHLAALQAVDGLEIGGRRVVLPRTADELVEWGRVLDNCLGGFRHAVASGRTQVLGLAEGNRLVHAVEITRGGVVRQFEAAGNRQAPEREVRPVLAALRAHGVVRADGRRGRSLLAPR